MASIFTALTTLFHFPEIREPSLHSRYRASQVLRPHPSSAETNPSLAGGLLKRRKPLCSPFRQTSLVASMSTPMRATTTTPVEPQAAFRSAAGSGDLLRYYGGSVSTTTFRGLLGVHSRCSPHGSLISFSETFSGSTSAHLLPPEPLPVLLAGAMSPAGI